MKTFESTSNLNIIQLEGKWYVSTSNKKRFWRNTESDTKAQAERKALEQMLQDAEWRFKLIKDHMMEKYDLSWEDIDNIIA